MFTHPDTVCSLSAFDYQHRLQEAAQDRIAASAQAGRQSPHGAARAAVLAVASYLGRLMSRPAAASQPSTPPTRIGVQAQSAGHAV